MTNTSPRLLVTAATGQLGRLVIDQLLEVVSADRVVVAVRDPAKAADFSARGVEVRSADYNQPDSWDAAVAGVGRVLLISSGDLSTDRGVQHGHVIDAAKRAGVGLVAYTSLLHADSTPLGLAKDHLATERRLRDSGVPFALLRNGWYTENYAPFIPAAVQHGAMIGSAGDGRVSSAARADYAAAAVATLTTDGHAGEVYELAGDDAFTLTQFAAEVSRAAGKPVAYRDLPPAEYQAALLGFGLPEPVAALLADSDVGTSQGGLFDGGRQLSRLIGRPTTPWQTTVSTLI